VTKAAAAQEERFTRRKRDTSFPESLCESRISCTCTGWSASLETARAKYRTRNATSRIRPAGSFLTPFEVSAILSMDVVREWATGSIDIGSGSDGNVPPAGSRIGSCVTHLHYVVRFVAVVAPRVRWAWKHHGCASGLILAHPFA
jgi:hypothetical protein